MIKIIVFFPGVITGVGVGFSLRSISFSPDVVQIILFPGELFLRMLKMVTLPLIMTSLVTGIGTVDRQSWGRMGSLTVLYYVTTTLVATFTGFSLVFLMEICSYPGSTFLGWIFVRNAVNAVSFRKKYGDCGECGEEK